mmetsp:Transcript_20319/g.81179  ORF Transcript_20319/g.81179 Transcript_20319/m.81179 type:complete len:348 (-) Transcript_20319:250-1293(-)
MPSPRPDGELVPLARDAEDFGIVPLEVVSAVGLPRLLLSRFAGVRPGDSPKIGAFHVDERTQYVPRAGLRDDASCESLLLAQSDGAASFGEAHPVAARVLATALGCRLVDNGRAVAWPGSIAMRRDLKEAEAVAAALGPLVDAFVATTSRGERVTLLRLVGDIEGALPEDSAESSGNAPSMSPTSRNSVTRSPRDVVATKASTSGPSAAATASASLRSRRMAMLPGHATARPLSTRRHPRAVASTRAATGWASPNDAAPSDCARRRLSHDASSRSPARGTYCVRSSTWNAPILGESPGRTPAKRLNSNLGSPTAETTSSGTMPKSSASRASGTSSPSGLGDGILNER